MHRAVSTFEVSVDILEQILELLYKALHLLGDDNLTSDREKLEVPREILLIAEGQARVMFFKVIQYAQDKITGLEADLVTQYTKVVEMMLKKRV